MVSEKSIINNYNKKGYVIVRSLLTKKLCIDAKEKSNKLTGKLKLPFSNKSYGFGDVRNIRPYNIFANNMQIKNISQKLINSEVSLGHFLLVNKAAWIGPDVEWHQEVFNFDIYAPGLNINQYWHNFIQVFIAIDDHQEDNGCLQVFEGSHKEGVLDFDDIVNINGSHKRRVKPKTLDKLVKRYQIKKLEMKSGDVLFFNHLLVHGSPSNMSSESRLSALIQFYNNKLKFNNKKFIEYSEFRVKFIQEFYLSSIRNIKEYKKKLTDFSKN